MATSRPFEITVEKVDSDKLVDVEGALLRLVADCVPSQKESGPEDPIDISEEKYAKRIVYGIKEMFGVDLAWEVVEVDGNVRKLAWRICNARRMLAPFRSEKEI